MIAASAEPSVESMKMFPALPIVAAVSVTSHLSPQLQVRPSVALRGHPIAVAVAGVEATSVQARAKGSTELLGRRLPWTTLVYDGTAWRGTLPPPELRGVYRLELKLGSRITTSPDWLVRVYARGTSARPAFATPEGVARWWVSTLPSRAHVVALKHWPLPAFDRRDPKLHQLLVVAYSRAGHPAVRDRLGMFVTAVRDDPHARWRLLEATESPS